MTPTGKRIQQEATHWASKAQLGPLTSEENAYLQRWLKADPRHHGAFIRANVVRATVERVAALTGGAVPAPPALSSWLGRITLRGMVPRTRFVAASAAVLVVSLCIGAFVYRASGDRYISGIGELRQVVLDDGSSMLLNTATKAVVRLSDDAREVKLSQGEALFDVARDPSRPFVVHADDVTVKAIGTAFLVRNLDSRIGVTVTEGVVEILHDDGAPAQRITADHHATMSKTQPILVQALTRHERDRQLAWRTGRLEFDGQSLQEAVDEMNRHNRRKIVVTDARLAREPVVGMFRSVDALTFASIAAAALDAKVADDGDVIHIEPNAGR